MKKVLHYISHNPKMILFSLVGFIATSAIIVLIVLLIQSQNKITKLEQSPETQLMLNQDSQGTLNTEMVVNKISEKNTNKITNSNSVLDSWEFKYPMWGTVKIPPYEERIERIKAICDFIEGPMRTYYGQAMQKHGYCSFVGPHQEPSVSYDLRDLMKSSKSTVELAWDQILAFESLKREVLNDYVNKMKNLNETQSVIDYKTYNSTTPLNCSNYANEKTALESQQVQTGNVDSSYGIRQREQLQQKYASCL
jgi:hypothetical protein